MGGYIPDLTERFPEGFGGVDMTDRYFPSSRYNPDPFELLDREIELERRYSNLDDEEDDV